MNTGGNAFELAWEAGVIRWLQARIGPAGMSVMSFFTLFGEGMMLILILGFVYWCYDKRLGKTLGLTVLSGYTLFSMLKGIFLRQRPYVVHGDIRIVRPPEPGANVYDLTAQGYSFPSGHSANVVTSFGTLATQLKKRWMTIAAVALPLLTGLSRMALGAHYPTDVLAGWTIGAACVLAIPLLERKVTDTRVLYGILLLLGLPGFFYCRSDDYFNAFGLLAGFMAGTLLEARCVKFESTRKPLWMIARLAGGLAVYFALNALLKLPFPKAFLEGGSRAARLVRCARYAVISFVEFGVYPVLFRLEKHTA